jgi:hypothetical protein
MATTTTPMAAVAPTAVVINPKTNRFSQIQIVAIIAAITGLVVTIIIIILRYRKQKEDEKKAADVVEAINGLPSREALSKMTDAERRAALEAYTKKMAERQALNRPGLNIGSAGGNDADNVTVGPTVKQILLAPQTFDPPPSQSKPPLINIGPLAEWQGTFNYAPPPPSKYTSGAENDMPAKLPETRKELPYFRVPVPQGDVWAKLKTICKSPNQILEVGISGHYHCYKPCPEGFEDFVIDPNAEAELYSDDGTPIPPKDGEPEVPQPYISCRAKCPIALNAAGEVTLVPKRDESGNPIPKRDKSGNVIGYEEEPARTDSGSGFNACRRIVRNRSEGLGKGTDVVKCPWSFLDEKGYDHESSNNYTQDCSKGIRDGQEHYFNYECAKGRTDVRWKSETITNSHHCSYWSRKKFLVNTSGQNPKKWVATAPIACGHDFELMPSNRAAFFTKNMTGTAIGAEGFDNKRGVFCYQMCPAGTDLIPSGPGEASSALCAQPCPLNTKIDETKPELCVKDGFQRTILIRNMEELIVE